MAIAPMTTPPTAANDPPTLCATFVLCAAGIDELNELNDPLLNLAADVVRPVDPLPVVIETTAPAVPLAVAAATTLLVTVDFPFAP
jgi:hypothetical protein